MEQRKYRFSGYLEPSEVRAIINAIPQVSRHPERDILLLELMWQSGARVSEAVDLKPERVGLTSLVLRNLKQVKRVKQRDGKFLRVPDDKADKEVEVSGELCRHIKDFCRRNNITRGQYVFQSNRDKTRPLCRKYVHRIMGKASEYAGVFKSGKANPRTGRQYKGAFPHLLRHGNAMLLLEETGDLTIAQEQLGHAVISSTQVYAYAKKPRLKKAIKEINWYSEGTEEEVKKKKRKGGKT